MIRYDIYDQQLNPGDHICCIKKGELIAGKIMYISLKGTIQYHPYSAEKKGYLSKVLPLRGYRIIKTAGLCEPAKIT